MDSSESSSEDECNIYVNAASKLNALNSQAKTKSKDDIDDIDDAIIIDDSPKNSPKLERNQRDNESTNDSSFIDDSSNDSCYIEEPKQPNTGRRNNRENNTVICIDDEVLVSDTNVSKRITRSCTKKKNIIPTRIESVVILNDTIEEELNKTYNSQEENDSYMVIGSPIVEKKSDSDNYEVSVKVLWRSNKMNRFEIRRYETFQKVFKHFAKLEEVPENQILITKKDKRISPFDTPASIDWSVIDILDGGIVSAEIAKKNNEHSTQGKAQDNVCKIKVQISDKKSLVVTLKPNERLIGLVCNCAEQLNIPESKLKFYFDGELIDTNETPESLDLDDEACVDLKISE